MVSLTGDPYGTGAVPRSLYWRRRPLTGRLCAVMHGTLEKRSLELIPQLSRAIRAGDVHELILTDEPGAGPGNRVNRIAYLGFCEFGSGGVMLAGDELRIGGRVVGQITGFDLTHMPNHLNIVVRGESGRTGKDLGLAVEDEVEVLGPAPA